MNRLMVIVLLAGVSASFPAQPQAAGEAVTSLADLADAADLVALVQVRDTDYEYTRSFPSGGTAFLQVLIPYKVTRPFEDRVEVYEEGLHAHECYFENPSVMEEGRRYLVFLKTNPDHPQQYRGLEQGCALEVFVNSDNRYALKFPVTGIRLSDDLGSHASAMDFNDAYAILANEDIQVAERNELLDRTLLIWLDDHYKYTHGVDLTVARQLMGPDALTLDRSLKRKAD